MVVDYTMHFKVEDQKGQVVHKITSEMSETI